MLLQSKHWAFLLTIDRLRILLSLVSGHMYDPEFASGRQIHTRYTYAQVTPVHICSLEPKKFTHIKLIKKITVIWRKTKKIFKVKSKIAIRRTILLDITFLCSREYLEALKSKWVNPVLNIIGVNSLKLGGLYFNNIKNIFLSVPIK